MGFFIDPGAIIDLQLQKRTAVYYPVFHEIEATKSIFGMLSSSQKQSFALNTSNRMESFWLIRSNQILPLMW